MGEVVSLQTSRRREAFRIVIREALWGRRHEVEVLPPTITHPMRFFRTYAEAQAHAVAIQRAEGWPIFSNCGDAPGPEAA